MPRFRCGLMAMALGAAVQGMIACAHHRSAPTASAPIPPQAVPTMAADSIEPEAPAMIPVSRPDFSSVRIVNLVEQTREEPGATTLAIARSAAASRGTFKDVYRLSLDLRKGDLVKVEGQVELTNDAGKNVLVAAELRAVAHADSPGQPSGRFGPINSQNITPDVHHLPVTARSLFETPRDGIYTFAIGVRAASEQAKTGDFLVIERGHGQLLATVYRPE